MAVVRIDIPKGVPQGQTSVTPQSPQSSAASSPNVSSGKNVLLASGALAGRATFSTAINEMRETSNESLATDLSNASILAGLTWVSIKTKGAAIAPIAINAAVSEVTRIRRLNRKNQERSYERELRGSRITYNQGRGF